MVAVPAFLAGATSSKTGWLFLPGFGLGLMLGMVGTGLAFSQFTRHASERGAVVFQRLAAAATGALGLWWIASAG